MKNKLQSLDWWLLLCFSFLIIVGLSIQYSAAGGELAPWALHQIYMVALSLPLMFFIIFIDHNLIFKYAYHIFVVSIILLVVVNSSGVTKMGATRWVNLFGLVLQPSELAKIAMILALSKCLMGVTSEQKASDLILPVLITLVPIVLTLMQPSLGSAIIMVMISSSIFFISGLKKAYFLWAAIIFIISTLPIWHFYLYDYQKLRMLSFLNPDEDLFGLGYNLLQSKIAIGAGGAHGQGFLQGSQIQLDFLPEKHTDFVFTIFTEEHGFFKTIMLFAIYLYLIISGLLVAKNAQSSFTKLVAVGAIEFFAVHVIINSGMVMGLLPIVGIPLPLLSYGGSFMLTSMICFALLLNIDIENKAKPLVVMQRNI